MFSRFKNVIQFVRFRTLHRKSARHIERWQNHRLRNLVTHASRHIPLYRELYAALKPESVRDILDLQRLPVTGKETFIGKLPEVFTDVRDTAPAYWSHTSGTSGAPFSFLRSWRVGAPWYTDSLRYRFLFARKPWLLNASNIRIARIKVRAAGGENRLYISVREFLDDERGAVERLAAFDPYIIESYTSILLALAEHVARHGKPEALRPAYIVSFGEVLAPHVRGFIEKMLGCEVYDRYGFEEVGPTATECKQHDGMHVHSESLIVEVIDDKGRRVPDGERGRIVVTDLFSKRMPFIRYDSGDTGIMRSGGCDCGEETPRLWVEGRYSAVVTIDNRRIHHLEFDAELDMFANAILQYQVAKRGEREVVVRVIPGPTFQDGTVGQIVANISRLLGEDVRVSVEVAERLPLTPRGKCRIVVDESLS